MVAFVNWGKNITQSRALHIFMKEKMKEHDISFKKESSMLCWRRILNTPWDQGQVWRVGGEWVTGQQGKM